MSQRYGLTKEEFGLVNSRGRTTISPLFNLKSLPLPGAEHYKVTIVISSKLIKLSVKRQKIRRQLKALVAQLKLPPLGLIFYLKEPIKQAELADLRLAVSKLSF